MTATDHNPTIASEWSEPFETLRHKWSEVPGGGPRRQTKELLSLRHHELLELWERDRTHDTTGENFGVRGWYHALYRDQLRGKRVLDVGAGMGFDALTFAQHGAEVTMLDIVEPNTRLQRRLADLLGVDADSFWMRDLDDLDQLPQNFDVIWCQGSLINAPSDVVYHERQALLRRLKPDGRWIELAYPRVRWEREGALPFDRWGEKTDGPGTPWMEWYDLEKLLANLAPARFDVVLSLEFHNSDFNWFDLLRRS